MVKSWPWLRSMVRRGVNDSKTVYNSGLQVSPRKPHAQRSSEAFGATTLESYGKRSKSDVARIKVEQATAHQVRYEKQRGSYARLYTRLARMWEKDMTAE